MRDYLSVIVSIILGLAISLGIHHQVSQDETLHARSDLFRAAQPYAASIQRAIQAHLSSLNTATEILSETIQQKPDLSSGEQFAATFKAIDRHRPTSQKSATVQWIIPNDNGQPPFQVMEWSQGALVPPHHTETSLSPSDIQRLAQRQHPSLTHLPRSKTTSRSRDLMELIVPISTTDAGNPDTTLQGVARSLFHIETLVEAEIGGVFPTPSGLDIHIYMAPNQKAQASQLLYFHPSRLNPSPTLPTPRAQLNPALLYLHPFVLADKRIEILITPYRMENLLLYQGRSPRIALSAGLFMTAMIALYLFHLVRKGRQFREQNRRLNLHNLILDISVARIPLHEKLQTILDQIVTLSQTQEAKGCIFLPDEKGVSLDVAAAIGMEQSESEACARRILANPQPKSYRSEEAHTPPYELHAESGDWQLPLSVGEQRLGTLLLRLPQSRQSAFEKSFLRAIAAEIAGLLHRENAQEELHLISKVFEHTSEAILIMDASARILNVNNAYLAITGYSREEVMGCNPCMSNCDPEDAETFKELWKSIYNEGVWEGEIWERRPITGERYPKWLTLNTVKDKQGNLTNLIGIFTDMSERKRMEQQMQRLAFYDVLTQLPNRALFRDRFHQELALSRRTGRPFGFFFLDLDYFKNVNDALGHSIGDKLLIKVARTIQSCLRESDTVARLGGDEFALLISQVGETRHLSRVAEKIIQSIGNIKEIQGHETRISASIGISVSPDDGDNFDALLKHADIAMYEAKAKGKNTFQFFTKKINDRISRRLQMERDLTHALKLGQFSLLYQPKVAGHTGRITSMEALLRWHHPNHGMVSPMDFIPILEETQLIRPVGRWIISTACQEARRWLDQGHTFHTIAVNLSAGQLFDPELLDHLDRTLEETGLKPEMLELEITESMVMEEIDVAIQTLNTIRQRRIRLALDDFGTGYSSLSYLKRLPVQILKIDRSFVRDMTIDRDDAAIVTSIIAMAKSLKLGIVAEGVETHEHAHRLKNLGCDSLQGYYFSKPISPQEMSDQFEVKHEI
ncbi:MAG: EAL domain-containing protein [Magnetococcales bacterium]|nr:EAL domain-containing protein [Magnetococcales bacterium]